jgi:hypothetical protein
MTTQTISPDVARDVVQKIKTYTEGKSKLTNRELCEDVLEAIGTPTHTREEVCREAFDD